jgi:hypothetical protein
MSSEELRYTVDNPRGIDCLTLEVLHYIQEAVVDVWLIMKLDFDLIEIGQSIIKNRLLSLSDPTRKLMSCRRSAWVERRALLGPALALLRLLL